MNKIITMDDLGLPELQPYIRPDETQLLHYYEPDPGLFIAESPLVIGRALKAGYQPISLLIAKNQLRSAQNTMSDMKTFSAQNTASDLQAVTQMLNHWDHVPIYTAEYDTLRQLTGFPMTRGMLALMKRKKMKDIDTFLVGKSRIAVLENVVNPTNVGAIIRSAAGLGMDGIILSHGCSNPLYRRAARVSMGTVFQIPWTILPKKNAYPHSLFDQLREKNFSTLAMALKENACSINDSCIKACDKIAIFMGSEGPGLCRETIDLCDHTIQIPMSNSVDSLNVAAASAVVFWELGNKSL